jgi:ribosomal small subunit protein bTHX
MGKGDMKTRRGKFFAGSFGKLRPKKKKKNSGITAVKTTPPPAGKTKPAEPVNPEVENKQEKAAPAVKKAQTKSSRENVEKDSSEEKE